MDTISVAKNNFLIKEQFLSKYATKSCESIRFVEENNEDEIRPSFYHDIDRIIHSLSYTRYNDKTQVFSFLDNDHISKRIIHVQLVSKIARTIGRALNLNEDLIEAIALGHDIGHSPLGHQGEYILNDISKRELNEYFMHNIQGVRYYMNVDNYGKGLNLSIQVLDGIMCHNGEILSNIYKPMKKNKEEFLREYYESYNDIEKSHKYSPMTLEGCVVRISDIIGYIGRDIEDAIMIGKIKREDIPVEISSVLGLTNKEIINTIILDIINESMNKPYIKMSNTVFNALQLLKKFNYENIYSKSMTEDEKKFYTDGINKIYKKYLNDLNTNNKESIIYKIFLDNQCKNYLENNCNKRIVLDFISGMTDILLLKEIKK